MKEIMCILPRVYDANGNLNEPWYVEFRYHNPETGKKQRFKKYGGINKHKTLPLRKKAANELCEEWTLKLKSGFNPFERDDVLYENHLMYERDEWKGREKIADYSIQYYLSQVLAEKKLMLERDNLRMKTYQAYLTKSRALALFLEEKKLDKLSIRDFQVEHARAFMEYIWTKIKHNKTWNIYLTTLRTFWIAIDKLYPRLNIKNPWRQIDLLKFDSTPATAFNSTQSAKIKNHLQEKDPYLLMICEIVYYCFIRPCSELPLLQVKDLNFDAKTITVTSKVSKNRKTQAVKIPQQLFDKFTSLNLAMYPEDNFVFTRFGHPYQTKTSRDYFSKRFKEVLKVLGFGKGYSMYSWKHTGNERLADSDIPVKFLQLQNRHHSLDQTATYQQSVKNRNSHHLYDNFPTM